MLVQYILEKQYKYSFEELQGKLPLNITKSLKRQNIPRFGMLASSAPLTVDARSWTANLPVTLTFILSLIVKSCKLNFKTKSEEDVSR